MKYVWINTHTGKISNSWSPDVFPENILHNETVTNSMREDVINNGWRLIEYRCINDKDFELYNKMRLR